MRLTNNVATVLAFYFCGGCHPSPGPGSRVPNDALRTQFTAVNPGDIVSVEFEGPFLSKVEKDGEIGEHNFEFDKTKIRDICSAFLKATMPYDSYGPSDLTDNIVFHFDEKLKRDDITVTINGRDALKDFGSEVQQVYERYRQRQKNNYDPHIAKMGNQPADSGNK